MSKLVAIAISLALSMPGLGRAADRLYPVGLKQIEYTDPPSRPGW